MNGIGAAAFGLLLLVVATILQGALGPSVSPYGVGPDFPLVVVAVLALRSRPAGGALAGFAAGLLMGGLAGANLTHYTISRIVAGFAVSSLKGPEARMGVGRAFAMTAVATVVGQLLFMFLAPPDSILEFLGATIGKAAINGVLAMPLHALLARLFKGKGV